MSLKAALIGLVALVVLASACTVPTSQSTQNNTTAHQKASATSGLSTVLPGNYSNVLGNYSNILGNLDNLTNVLPSDIPAKIEEKLNTSL
ncbi:MAG: hypothetical protein ACXV5N_09475 [Halobacteriota archaeon]